MSTKVFIVDDHQIFRNGLKDLLSEIKDIEVVGEASDGKDFLKKIKSNFPDIVLMDIKMPNMNGIEATKKAKELYPEIKILGLSMYDDYEYLDELIDAGAVGYMLKNIGKNELENAISSINSGSAFFCDNMIKVAVQKINSSKKSGNTKKIIDSISNRELEVLKLICLGLSAKKISEHLHISPRTVEGHRNNMLKKTGLNSTAALVSFAINNKVVKI